MEIDDFNKVFNIDFDTLPKLRKNKSATWGNVSNDDLINRCFENISKYFPEAKNISPHFLNKIKITIGLSFMRVNEDGERNYPKFSDFLTCSIMSLTQKDIKNSYDKQLYISLSSLLLNKKIKLAS